MNKTVGKKSGLGVPGKNINVRECTAFGLVESILAVDQFGFKFCSLFNLFLLRYSTFHVCFCQWVKKTSLVALIMLAPASSEMDLNTSTYEGFKFCSFLNLFLLCY